MKVALKLLLACFLGLGLITTLDSCQKVEGCTDPDAENYNADAEESDGSCTYAREKFIGTFQGMLSCGPPLPNDEDFTIVIAEGLSNNAEVLITFQDVESPIPELSARVDGDKLIIDPERVSIPLDPNNPEALTEIEFSGEATIAGDNLSGTLDTKVVLLSISSSCNMTATRQ